MHGLFHWVLICCIFACFTKCTDATKARVSVYGAAKYVKKDSALSSNYNSTSYSRLLIHCPWSNASYCVYVNNVKKNYQEFLTNNKKP